MTGQRTVGTQQSGTAAGLGLALALAFPMAAGWAKDGTPPAALALSPDGQEVINTPAGLAWARCVEGMQWSGKTCVGSPRYLDHTQALAAAAARRQADGLPWRLPRVPELKRLAGPGWATKTSSPSPFPAAPGTWHWTSTTTVDTSRLNPYAYGNIQRGVTGENMARISFLHGWAVHTGSGEADGEVNKRTRLPVRLVRSLAP